jgi:glycosyltransferase involved in cell wall biosynthesis
MELRMAAEARLLQESGTKVIVATRTASPLLRWMQVLRSSGIDARSLNVPPAFEEWSWRRVNKMLIEVMSARVLRRWGCQLNHIFMPWTDLGGSLLWASHVAKIPVVLSIHNAFPVHSFHPWYDKLLAEAYSSVAGIYAVSRSAMDHYDAVFGRYIRPGTVRRVIPNFVDTDDFLPSPERRALFRSVRGIPADALVLGSVGRLSDQKRPEALVKVFARLRKEFPNLHLVLVGDGPLKAAIEELVRALGLMHCVHITGYVEDVEDVIPAFDVHVLLSSREGFGIATAEAMACGIPVVGSDVPGTADILSAMVGGRLVPLDDEDAIVAVLRTLLRSPDERANMGAIARQTAERCYSAQIWKKNVLAFYSEVLSSAAASAEVAFSTRSA